ncbi:MAG: lysylphosphatidylglycerol synthase transmembrane domain-containing protein [Longimicrobiales bacterium]
MKRRPFVRVAVSAGLLALLARTIDLGDVAARLASLAPGWVVGALALSVLQVGVSAWRWRFTAARLGLELPLGPAVAEYYLATFLNQVLPGGVLGDVSRAWRHTRAAGAAAGLDTPARRSLAIHAVVLERASGQTVMLGVAALSGVVLLGGWIWGGVAGVILAAFAWGVARRGTRDGAAADVPVGVVESARRALFAPAAFGAQAASSVFVVATYLATWWMAARALGIDTPSVVMLPLVAPVLVTMLVPVSVAGWGVREGGAAVLWTWAGLPAADGVAISVVYGLLVLVGSLPGLGVAALSRGARSHP